MQQPCASDRIPSKRTARTAGVFYLLMGLGTAFGMGYVNPLLFESLDGAVVANTIRSSESLFLAGFASTSMGLVAMLFLANALFGLFESVDRSLARLLVIFVVAGVSIEMLNMVNLLTAIQLLRSDGHLSAFDPSQRNGLIMTSLAAYRFGSNVAGVFWGLWLLPFGLLILRSRFIPRVLGVLMTIGCFTYLLHSTVRLLLPSYGQIVQQSLLIPTLGEVGTIAWLLIVGVRERRPADRGK